MNAWHYMKFRSRRVRGRLYEINLVESSYRPAVRMWQTFLDTVPGGKLYVLRDRPRKGETFLKQTTKG